MKNFDSYYDFSEDDLICEGEHGCGEVLIRTPFSDGWFCNNEFCPEKFQSTEQRMAEALVEYMEEVRTLKAKLVRANLELDVLRK